MIIRKVTVSPPAEEAMAKLTELFSDPRLPSKAQFRCCVEGPTDLEIMIESIFDDGNGEYKHWVPSLYRLGLIPTVPKEWEVPDSDVARKE